MEIEKNLEKGHMAFIKDVGHSIHMEAPMAFNQVLGNFLDLY
ncbi:alpha/beta fold hydrolase [Desulfobacula sp.]